MRLREHGHGVTGEVFLVPRDGEGDGVVEKLDQVGARLRAVDWRLHDLVLVIVPSLEREEPPLIAQRSA